MDALNIHLVCIYICKTQTSGCTTVPWARDKTAYMPQYPDRCCNQKNVAAQRRESNLKVRRVEACSQRVAGRRVGTDTERSTTTSIRSVNIKPRQV